MANAPAIHSPEIGGALFYPAVVMNNIVAPTQCVFQAFQNATIAQCDPLDGVQDGLISDLSLCDFDPQTLVGTQIECGGSPTTITDEHAEVVSLIYRGPRRSNGDFLWYGVPPGASFGALANTTSINGTVVPAPFGAAENFVRYMILQDPSFDTSAINFTEYERIHDQAIAIYAPIMGSEYPDLEGFQKAGGKLLTFHGLADQAIPPEGTTLFRDRLAEATGGQDAVDEFYRVFFGPGAGHCGGGYGPWPDNELAVLINWVENGVAPDVLASTLNRTDGTSLTRNICRYPQQLQYVSGDVSIASSFTCA